MIRTTLLLVVFAMLLGCNNPQNSSPFEEILSQPAFAPLSDSIRREPARDDLYFHRAVLLNKNNFPAPALADFQQAWQIKKDERYAFGISTLLLDQQPDSAIIFLDQALQELPESVLLRISLARAYDALGKKEQALTTCNAILQAEPNRVEVLKMKAELLGSKGDTTQAIRILEKIYSLTPQDIDLNYVLAVNYAESKNPRVLSLCDSLIRMDSLGVHAEPYYYKGIYFSNTNDPVKALWFFNEAIKHDYNFLDAHIEKGIVLYEQKKWEDAYKAFNLAMTISPKYADSYYWMAKAQQAMGQKEEALLNYQRAYGLDKTITQAKDSADHITR